MAQIRPLADYILAISHPAAELPLVAREISETSYEEQGYLISERREAYRFGDGVVIALTTEYDAYEASHTACGGSSLVYEVLAQGQGVTVMPLRKTFDNSCQAHTWLGSQR